MQCRQCQKGELFRVEREGFLQTKVLPRWGYYPWKCSLCHARTLLKSRGPGKRRKPSIADAWPV